MLKAQRINIGILAHVDAGKTTLAESILYLTGSIRKAGRVDHGDAFLDTDEAEKRRGITIFSKMAQMQLHERMVTMVDTPGHADFSAEMERTLQILDYAILLISAPDGIQGQVMTLWRLLERYQVPTFIFVNKMDQPGTDAKAVMQQLRENLSEGCVCFGEGDLQTEDAPACLSPDAVKGLAMADLATLLDEESMEAIAVADDALLEAYLEGEMPSHEQIRNLIQERKVFPCWFGSALKRSGIRMLLEGVSACMKEPEYPSDFGARVYKVSRDQSGTRLTWLKVTGGILKAKQLLNEEKVDQIRIWSGAGYTTTQEAGAGTVCAVAGPEKTFAWQGIGVDESDALPILEPVVTYAVKLPAECDVHSAYLRLRQLEEEIPELHLKWNEKKREIHAGVMGQVQIEILRDMIRSRYGLPVNFDTGCIVYKETIADRVEGIGHYEPLRHYAEVHLLMEPGEPGSGLIFDTDVSTDELALNWQRLIMTHLEEKHHVGVLTGSEITDMKITLIAGKAHLKHTEGGDFRQSVYRAVRQGLMKAHNVLLEPVFSFRLEVPESSIGRAMTDIKRMEGDFEGPVLKNGMAILTGKAPAACMNGYQSEVAAYSGGTGSLTCTLAGYEPCHNSEEVIDNMQYDPETDAENVSGSVFCSHGAGMFIPWYQVGEFMHLEARIPSAVDGSLRHRADEEMLLQEAAMLAHENRMAGDAAAGVMTDGSSYVSASSPMGGHQQTRYGKSIPADIQDDAQLYEIFMRTYGSVKQERAGWKKFNRFDGSRRSDSASTRDYSGGKAAAVSHAPQYLLVDGYNIIYAWNELAELAKTNLDGARGRLMDILSNFQGFRSMTVILVFDAYKVEGGTESVEKYHNIYVVYTKEAETADAYIERSVRALSRNAQITVATSDAAEQVIIFGAGARRMSARELKDEIRRTCDEIARDFLRENPGGRNYLFENVEDELAALLEEVRLGKRTLE